jgi:hypothetical protein
MIRSFSLLAASAIALAPAMALAPTQPPGQGQYNGTNYWHMNGPAHATGQPGADCEDLVASGEGATPGQSANSPGGGSPFSGEDSTGGSHYAGSQPQNSRNTASVSQYDVACANQTP